MQHAVYRVIYPLFDARFIDTTFACRKGYGTHRASDYIQSALKCYPGDYYLLQIDIRRYFDSIDRNILLQLLARTIKDEALLDLMMEFATIPEKASGIPIGNLLSQLYAGIYLSGFDHFIKRDLKIRHYARYVDDAVLIGIPSYDRARLYLSMIQFYLWSHLELDLSRWHISPIRKGVNFCGYRTWRSKRFIRKYSLYKFTRAIKRHNLPAITSLLGHAMRTNSLSSMLNRLERSNNKQMLQIARKTKERLKRNNSE